MTTDTFSGDAGRELAVDGASRTGSVARWTFGIGVAAFILSRIYMLLFFNSTAIATDLPIYFTYGVRGVDLGQTAYSEFSVEYPPLAYWAVTAPRQLRRTTVTEDELVAKVGLDGAFRHYVALYRGAMIMADVLAFFLVLKIGNRLHPRGSPWMACGYVAVTTPLAHVLYDRLDMLLLLLLMIWIYGRVRSQEAGPLSVWNVVSYIALGLSIPYKLVGIVVIPLVLFADARQEPANRQRFMTGGILLSVCLAFAAFPFIVQALSSGAATLSFLTYHAERGIEIESTYGTVLMALSLVGLPIETEVSYGSANLVTPLSAGFAAASPFLLLGMLVLLAFTLYRCGDRDREAGTQAGMLAVLLLLVCSKVLSTQYFVFALPLLLLLTVQLRPAWSWFLIPAQVVVAIATTLVFPYLWFPTYIGSGAPNPYCLVPDLSWLPCLLLALRNTLFLAMVAAFWWALALGRRRKQAC